MSNVVQRKSGAAQCRLGVEGGTVAQTDDEVPKKTGPASTPHARRGPGRSLGSLVSHRPCCFLLAACRCYTLGRIWGAERRWGNGERTPWAARKHGRDHKRGTVGLGVSWSQQPETEHMARVCAASLAAAPPKRPKARAFLPLSPRVPKGKG